MRSGTKIVLPYIIDGQSGQLRALHKIEKRVSHWRATDNWPGLP